MTSVRAPTEVNTTPSTFNLILVVRGQLTTTQGLDVAMSVSVPAIQLYLVFLQMLDAHSVAPGSLLDSPQPCDSAHMDEASYQCYKAFQSFSGLRSYCTACVGDVSGAADQSGGWVAHSPAHCGRSASGHHQQLLTKAQQLKDTLFE